LETETLKSEAPATAKGPPSWAQWLYKIFYQWLLIKGSRLLFVLGGVMIVSQVLTVIIDSGSRYFPWGNPFGGGGIEIEELQMGMLSAMMLGYTWFLGWHIRIELLRDKMKPRLGAIADTLAGVCGVLYSAGVSWGVLKNGLDNWSMDSHTDMLQIPIAPFQIFFTLVFIHFTFILLAYSIQSIYRIFNPAEAELKGEKGLTENLL
jgi:TRAP-type C4-dicarboxylate transport system permease small subunit